MNVFFWFLFILAISWVFFIYVFPFLLRIYLKRLSGKFEKHAEQESRSKKEEGSVSIDYVPEKHIEKENDAPGDYVNYEEIDEK